MFRLRARDRSSFGSSERPEEPPTSWTTGVGRSTSIQQAWKRVQQIRRTPLRNVRAWMQTREPYSPWPNHEQDDWIIEENGDVYDFSDDRKELFTTAPGESKSSTAQWSLAPTALAYKQTTESVIDLNHEMLRRQLRYNIDGQNDDNLEPHMGPGSLPVEDSYLDHETLRRQLRYNVDGRKDDKSREPLPNTVREIHVKKDNSILSSCQSIYAENHDDNVKDYNDDTVPPLRSSKLSSGRRLGNSSYMKARSAPVNPMAGSTKESNPRICNGAISEPTETSSDKRSRKKNDKPESSITDSSNSKVKFSHQPSHRNLGSNSVKGEDALWIKRFHQIPGQMKMDKKILPNQDLKCLVEELFDSKRRGQSYVDEFLEIYEVSKDLKHSLSLPDESNILHFLRRNGIVPREVITGQQEDIHFTKQNFIFPLSDKAEPFHRSESTTANSDHAQAQLDQHSELMMKLGLGEEGIDVQAKISLADEEPAVTSHVESFTQQPLVDAIFVVMKESFRLNAEKQVLVFGTPNVQSTQKSYSAQLDISTMDSIYGTTYSGCEPWPVLAKTRSQSIVQDRSQITMLSLALKKNEYLKSLHSMLTIQLIGPGNANQAITKVEPTRQQPPPTLISNKHAELSAVDGSSVTVLPNTYVMPSLVPSRGRTICTIQDWMTAMEDLDKAKWTATGTTADSKKIPPKISQQTGSPPNKGRTGSGLHAQVNICGLQYNVENAQLDNNGKQMDDKATQLLLDGPGGTASKSSKRSILITSLTERYRTALTTHGKVIFHEDPNFTPLNHLIQSKHISDETLNAYMLNTYPHTAEIAEQVELLHQLRPPEKERGEDASDASVLYDQSTGEMSSKSPLTIDKSMTKKTQSKSSSPDDVIVHTDNGRLVFIGGKLYAHDQDDSAESANHDEDDEASGIEEKSADSKFDYDSGSHTTANKNHHRKSKRLKKKRGSGT